MPHIKDIYQPELLELGELVKPGARKEGVVTNIVLGKLTEFIDQSHIDKWPEDKRNDLYLNITCEYDGGTQKSVLISKPKGFTVNPRSKLAKWKKMYGDWPQIGQKVYLLADGDGYFQFHL